MCAGGSRIEDPVPYFFQPDKLEYFCVCKKQKKKTTPRRARCRRGGQGRRQNFSMKKVTRRKKKQGISTEDRRSCFFSSFSFMQAPRGFGSVSFVAFAFLLAVNTTRGGPDAAARRCKRSGPDPCPPPTHNAPPYLPLCSFPPAGEGFVVIVVHTKTCFRPLSYLRPRPFPPNHKPLFDKSSSIPYSFPAGCCCCCDFVLELFWGVIVLCACGKGQERQWMSHTQATSQAITSNGKGANQSHQKHANKAKKSRVCAPPTLLIL